MSQKNWNRIINSLSKEEFQRLSSSVHERSYRENRIEAENVALNNDEKQLAADNRKIAAIKALRCRTKGSLVVCKTAVELYMNSLKEDPSISPTVPSPFY